jgi:hypothetical protein
VALGKEVPPAHYKVVNGNCQVDAISLRHIHMGLRENRVTRGSRGGRHLGRTQQQAVIGVPESIVEHFNLEFVVAGRVHHTNEGFLCEHVAHLH